MRTIYIIFVGLGVVIPVMAQDLAKEAVELNAQAQENALPDAGTNGTATVVQTQEEQLAEKLSFLTDTAMQYADEGEFEAAERAYLRVVEAAPDNDEILFRLSALYIRMNRYSEAISLLRAQAEKHPKSMQIHNNLAWCYATGLGVKNKKLALRHAREALLLSPSAASVWNTLAEAYYAAGDYEKALRSTNRAIDILTHTGGDPTVKQKFQEQRSKILRAQKVLKQFEKLDEE